VRSICLMLIGFLTWQLIPSQANAQGPVPQWIWLAADPLPQKVVIRKKIAINAPIKKAVVAATCDNQFTLFINGQQALAGNEWTQLESSDVTKLLRQGDNIIAVEAIDEGGLAGFIARLDVTSDADKTTSLVTDKSWKVSVPVDGQWKSAGFNDASWKESKEFGPAGGSGLPWSGSIDASRIAAAVGQALPPAAAVAQTAKNVTANSDFKVEKIFDVPSYMGSWVNLTTDPQGRLIASDQGGAGLYLIQPAKLDDPNSETRVEKLPVRLSGAQGLLWAFDSLYVMVNGDKPGLHRAKDTNGDGLVDSEEYLMSVPGGGEHGPHALILSPDGKSIFADAGNHTPLPEKIAGSRLPTNWGEDHLLPRRWDANGHAAGILAPGGWICNVDPSGKQWQVFSSGYRNHYDIAFNADGELFAYDADMEWDFGSPWYRPTRVCHATSGSEFGWRSGTGKWPAYYDDSLPPVVDIGPGSPVGVVFGYGAKFPAKYQKSLFILDWTYSTIYAVHLTPDGASYKGQVEDFVFGQPLQVTDAIIGHDGAMYFTAGGRGTQSSLYRVTYTGSESTAPVDYEDSRNAELRALRHRLESFHGPGDADMDLIWSNLGHADRFIRYAARIALENRPADSWRDRALREINPRAAITALMALARQGKPEVLDSVLASLGKIDSSKIAEFDQLALARTYQLAFVRLGKPSDEWRAKLIAKFDAMFPSKSESLNAEVVQLLVYLESPSVVSKAVALMDDLARQTEPIPQWSEIAKRNTGYGGTVQAMMDNMPPVRAIHYAFVLRNAKTGWTPELRRAYFKLFNKAAMHPGGASFPGFLKQMRDDALATVPPSELPLYDEILSVPLGGKPFEATPAKGPGRKWSKADALAELGAEIKGASFNSGRNLFHATTCAKCHRFAGEGGAIGPDLSTAGRKFALPDLMDAILEPSKAISDQYGSHQILTNDGTTLLGRVVEISDEYHVYTLDANAPPTVVKKSDVEEMNVSKISQMPVGTMDALNPQEFKDLIAYILSGGDQNAAVFK
jgi:putative heme-binding domain-containing protein